MRGIFTVLRDWFWHPCPNCENWTTETFEHFVWRMGLDTSEDIVTNNEPNDNKLYHCFECGIWFREG